MFSLMTDNLFAQSNNYFLLQKVQRNLNLNFSAKATCSLHDLGCLAQSRNETFCESHADGKGHKLDGCEINLN